MSIKKNIHCTIAGCKTKKPHIDEPTVKEIFDRFGSDEKLAAITMAGLNDLSRSIQDDIKNERNLSFLSRMRQIDELYYRMLYAIFIVNENELYHVLSGDTPNGFSLYYEAVNKGIFKGAGKLATPNSDLGYGKSTIIGMFNSQIHVDYRTLLLCADLTYAANNAMKMYPVHLIACLNYTNYIHEMFKAGKCKNDVKEGVINLHK